MNEASQRGFTLLEMVCVLAIIALLAAVLLPFIPHQTSRSRLQAYALQTATLLKADRNAAIERSTSIATLVDAASRVIHAGPAASSSPLRPAQRTHTTDNHDENPGMLLRPPARIGGSTLAAACLLASLARGAAPNSRK